MLRTGRGSEPPDPEALQSTNLSNPGCLATRRSLHVWIMRPAKFEKACYAGLRGLSGAGRKTAQASEFSKQVAPSYGLSRVSVQVAQYCELLPQPAGESVPG